MSGEYERGRAALDQFAELAARASDIRAELTRLRRIEEWALAQLPVAEGDRVVLTETPTFGPGWRGYEEVLVPGRRGTATNFHLYDGEWRAHFAPETCWYFSQDGRTRWFKRDGTAFVIRVSRLAPWRGEDDAPVPDGAPVLDGIKETWHARD